MLFPIMRSSINCIQHCLSLMNE